MRVVHEELFESEEASGETLESDVFDMDPRCTMLALQLKRTGGAASLTATLQGAWSSSASADEDWVTVLDIENLDSDQLTEQVTDPQAINSFPYYRVTVVCDEEFTGAVRVVGV